MADETELRKEAVKYMEMGYQDALEGAIVLAPPWYKRSGEYP